MRKTIFYSLLLSVLIAACSDAVQPGQKSRWHPPEIILSTDSSSYSDPAHTGISLKLINRDSFALKIPATSIDYESLVFTITNEQGRVVPNIPPAVPPAKEDSVTLASGKELVRQFTGLPAAASVLKPGKYRLQYSALIYSESLHDTVSVQSPAAEIILR